jgi:hypothetical protein
MDTDERRSEACLNGLPMSQQTVSASNVMELGICCVKSVSICVHLWFRSASFRMMHHTQAR